MARISKRLQAVASSATLEISKTVTEMRAAGKRVHDLGLGEADYAAPRAACDALAAVAASGRSRYTDVQGTIELRRAIARSLNCAFYHKTGGAAFLPSYSPSEIIVSTGSKHLQYSSVLALCDPGDEVVLFSPYWVSYPDMVRMAGAEPVVVAAGAEEAFVPGVDRIAEAITPHTRLIFLNSPNNPTGRVWPRETIDALCELVLSHDGLYLLSDEIYSELAFGAARHVSPVTHSARMRERVILTGGLSKAYAMGGWRIGHAAIGDADVIGAVRRVAANTISSPPSVTQDAAVYALDARSRVLEMRLDFEQRAALAARRLNAMGLATRPPEGAFYAFADVSSLFGRTAAGCRLASAGDVALALLRDAGVACVAGEAFGDDRHVRLSFVRPLAELEAACDAIEAFVLRCRARRDRRQPTPAADAGAMPAPSCT